MICPKCGCRLLWTDGAYCQACMSNESAADMDDYQVRIELIETRQALARCHAVIHRFATVRAAITSGVAAGRAASDETAVLRARVEELEAALAPFAALQPAHWSITDAAGVSVITPDDVRRAKAVLLGASWEVKP